MHVIDLSAFGPLAATNNANYLFLLGMMLVTGTLLRRIYRRRRVRSPAKTAGSQTSVGGQTKVRTSALLRLKRPRRLTTAQKATSPNPAAVGAPTDLRSWEVHMHETVRQLSAQLDSKMVAVEQLLTAVEQERHRIESLLATLPSDTDLATTVEMPVDDRARAPQPADRPAPSDSPASPQSPDVLTRTPPEGSELSARPLLAASADRTPPIPPASHVPTADPQVRSTATADEVLVRPEAIEPEGTGDSQTQPAQEPDPPREKPKKKKKKSPPKPVKRGSSPEAPELPFPLAEPPPPAPNERRSTPAVASDAEVVRSNHSG